MLPPSSKQSPHGHVHDDSRMGTSCVTWSMRVSASCMEAGRSGPHNKECTAQHARSTSSCSAKPNGGTRHCAFIVPFAQVNALQAISSRGGGREQIEGAAIDWHPPYWLSKAESVGQKPASGRVDQSSKSVNISPPLYLPSWYMNLSLRLLVFQCFLLCFMTLWEGIKRWNTWVLYPNVFICVLIDDSIHICIENLSKTLYVPMWPYGHKPLYRL